MGELKDLTVEEFTARTASSAPVPGGGSVAALAGALAVALSEMVANLTIGKAKYAGVEEEMRKLAEKGAELRGELLEGIRKDSTSFGLYMEAFAMPKTTEEEKAVRREAMQRGLRAATEAPLAIAEAAARIFPIAEAVVLRGNTGAVTDGLMSAMLARTAVLSALLNVKINLGSIKEEAFAAATAARIEELEKLALHYEKQILKASELTEQLQ